MCLDLKYYTNSHDTHHQQTTHSAHTACIPHAGSTADITTTQATQPSMYVTMCVAHGK